MRAFSAALKLRNVQNCAKPMKPWCVESIWSRWSCFDKIMALSVNKSSFFYQRRRSLHWLISHLFFFPPRVIKASFISDFKQFRVDHLCKDSCFNFSHYINGQEKILILSTSNETNRCIDGVYFTFQYKLLRGESKVKL